MKDSDPSAPTDFTYFLHDDFVKLAEDVYSLTRIPLSMRDDGSLKDEPDNDEEAFVQFFEESAEARSLKDWGVEREYDLPRVCDRYNKDELNRARVDLRTWQNKLKELPASEDLKEIVTHIERVVGRFDRWFGENGFETEREVQAEPKEYPNSIIKRGEMWAIKFHAGEEFMIGDYRGMRYIASLLRNPRSPVHINEFFAGRAAKMSEAQIVEEGISVEKNEREADVIDTKGKAEIEKEIREIIAKMKTAREIGGVENEAILAECEDEIDILRGYLGAQPPRKNVMSKTLKRRIDAVRKSINDTNKRINEHDKNLFQHLNQSIKIREWLGYFPYEDTDWRVEV